MTKTTKIATVRRAPPPCFDAIDYIDNAVPPAYLSTAQCNDFGMARDFLQAYTGSLGTFTSYRRDVERLLLWTWFISEKVLEDLKRNDIEDFIRFCQKPPIAWLGLKRAARFREADDGTREPNPVWRPFLATVSKSAFKKGQLPDKSNYSASNGAIKQLIAITGSFFQFLQLEEYTVANPVALIRQKSKFVQKRQGHSTVRRLSQQQWQALIQSAEDMAEEKPESHERTLFMITALYGMYLRISELGSSERWTPTMNDFHKDHDGRWWFTTVGKGNKERQIAVSDTMLAALKRWRKYQSMSTLPTPADNAPLFPLHRGKGPIGNTTHVRNIVQLCFDRAIENLAEQGFKEEAEAMMDATVHWLRHTGISDDVKTRPREHVRDDAGHSSSAITDRYVDVELKERHKSAKRKKIRSQ
ncbi:tyrosine-type recombinase/integrase [Granulosicoccus sp.]|nr:tyrosine-type recombinase/integrase [Granulosicoccus sp.]MDB4223377.1 tyrosine-type recombinase/integrase [Granulosicoccus sp.]